MDGGGADTESVGGGGDHFGGGGDLDAGTEYTEPSINIKREIFIRIYGGIIWTTNVNL